MDIPHLVVKLPDDARNWKPSDFIVWVLGGNGPRSAFVEVKDVDAALTFPLRDLRPSQRLGIREAVRLEIPYWVVVWWRKRGYWTITDGAKILAEMDKDETITGLPLSWMTSVAGIDARQADLSMLLRGTLLGELD
jgi:hypothetical protein